MALIPNPNSNQIKQVLPFLTLEMTSMLTPFSNSENCKGINLATNNDIPIHQSTIPLLDAKPKPILIIAPFMSPTTRIPDLEQNLRSLEPISSLGLHQTTQIDNTTGLKTNTITILMSEQSQLMDLQGRKHCRQSWYPTMLSSPDQTLEFPKPSLIRVWIQCFY